VKPLQKSEESPQTGAKPTAPTNPKGRRAPSLGQGASDEFGGEGEERVWSTKRYWAIALGVLGILILGAVIWLLHIGQRRIESAIDELKGLDSRLRWVEGMVSRPPSPQDQKDKRIEDEKVQRELTQLTAKVDQIVVIKADIQRHDNRLESAKESLETVAEDVGQVMETLKTHESLLAELRKRNLSTYFEEWKEGNLKPGLEQESGRILQEFMGNPANRKLRLDNQATQERILDKARKWCDGLASWIRVIQSAASPGNGAEISNFAQRYEAYCRRAKSLISELESSRAKFDLKSVPFDSGVDMTFFHVVSGHSAELISAGYLRRLNQQLEELVRNTARFTQEWEKVRIELLDLLDQFYGLMDSQAHGGGKALFKELDMSLRDALRVATVQEILVEANRTLYDPSVHEPLPGSRVTRTDLPENTVIFLEKRGFLYEGKVLRRALVSLSTKRG
jgi:molecular chaperone GrpE (heat shock protein)